MNNDLRLDLTLSACSDALDSRVQRFLSSAAPSIHRDSLAACAAHTQRLLYNRSRGILRRMQT